MAFDLSEVMIGMLVVETIAKIRRAYFQQKKAIKAICREFGVSRKVVRKVIRTNATEFVYERERQPLPKIGGSNLLARGLPTCLFGVQHRL